MPCTKKGDKRDEAWGFPWLPPTSQRPGGVQRGDLHAHPYQEPR